MPALLPGQIAMEKTPGYFHTPGVARRIWEANNMTKLVTIIMIIIITIIILVTMQVLIIRNPVDRMISDYNQFRSRHLDRGQVATYLHIYLSTHPHIYVSTRTTRRWSTSSSRPTATSTSATSLCSAASTTTTLSGRYDEE